jgi:hypothetical protein
VVGLRYFELFLLYWILIFEMYFMSIVLSLSQVILVQADGLLVLEQDVDVSFSELVWNLQVEMSCDLISGQLGSGSVRNIAFDGCLDFSGGVVHEGVELIFLDFYYAHHDISLNGDFVRCAIFENDFAVVVFINAD